MYNYCISVSFSVYSSVLWDRVPSICVVVLRPKIKGAVEHCKAKKLTKECIYEKVKKYLVLTSDRVE